MSFARILVATAVPLLAGCPDDLVRSDCLLEYSEVTVPHQPDVMPTPLMLMPDARLDAVGDGFVLLGTDGVSVRWALLGKDAVVVGDEHVIPVPEHRAGPWFAVAGLNAPADHLVIAYVPVDTTGTPPVGDRDLLTFSVRIDNTAPTPPVSSGFIPVSAQVTMASGRGGMHAGVAWAKLGQSAVVTRLLGGDGLPIGPDHEVATVADSVPGCLRFSAGKGDLTLGFVDTSISDDPIFVATEFAEDGAAFPAFRLRLGEDWPDLPGCVQLASAGTGYGVGWHSAGLGFYFGTYDSTHPGFPSVRVRSDVRISGAVPPLGAVAWLGRNYAMLFARSDGAELWPIDAMGDREGELPRFPSAVGITGALSAQNIGSTLYVTYADYTGNARPTSPTSGSRLLVKVSCP